MDIIIWLICAFLSFYFFGAVAHRYATDFYLTGGERDAAFLSVFGALSALALIIQTAYLLSQYQI